MSTKPLQPESHLKRGYATPSGGLRATAAAHRGVIRRGIRRLSNSAVREELMKRQPSFFHATHGSIGRKRTWMNQMKNQHVTKQVHPTTF